MKRIDISRLEKNRSLHFKLGFIIAISLVTLAFNYRAEPPVPYEHNEAIVPEVDFIAQVPVTKEKPKELPPPDIKISDNIIPEDTPEFTETPEPKVVETTIEVAPVEYPIPEAHVVSKRPPAPQLPPSDPVEDETPPVFDVVEHMPLFGDCAGEELSKEEKRQCSALALLKYMGKHIKYPALARENNIQGTVVVRFVVDEFGKISSPEIIRDIGGGCGQEALRVVRKMPVWEPGRQRNRKVKVYFNLPVKFRLD